MFTLKTMADWSSKGEESNVFGKASKYLVKMKRKKDIFCWGKMVPMD